MRNKNELISVIVPIYNAEKYLQKCLDSIIQQTYTYLEIILIDDGSIDRSMEICDSYTKKDGRIQVIHKKNQGVSAARNDGIKRATGEYIAFVDADDYIFPDYFDYLYTLLKKYDADMACCDLYKMWDTETLPLFDNCEEEILYTAEEALRDFFYNKNITGHPFLKLYKRNLVGQLAFPEKMHYGEDIFFVFHTLQKCKSVVHGTKILYIYIQNDASVTHNFDLKKMFISWRMLQKEIMEYVTKKQGLLSAASSRLLIHAIMYCCAIGKGKEQATFRAELLNAIRQYSKFAIKDRREKKLISIMAIIGCVSPRLLVQLCKFNIFLRRTFRIAIRQSV